MRRNRRFEYKTLDVSKLREMGILKAKNISSEPPEPKKRKIENSVLTENKVVDPQISSPVPAVKPRRRKKLVGNDRTVMRLTNCIAQISRGAIKNQIIFVYGPVGCGKTTMVGEVLRRAGYNDIITLERLPDSVSEPRTLFSGTTFSGKRALFLDDGASLLVKSMKWAQVLRITSGLVISTSVERHSS